MTQPALAQKFNYPKGHFADKDWEVSLSFDNNVYYYYGENRRNRNSNINLSGAVTSGTNDRQVYTWNNNGMKYRDLMLMCKIAMMQLIVFLNQESL